MFVPPIQTFCDLPLADANLAGSAVVVLGASEASPYDGSKPSHSANAPAAIRAVSKDFAGQLRQFDFDLQGALFTEAGETHKMFDAGDIRTDAADAAGNRTRIQEAVGQVLRAEAVPVLLGGDDSVPIPFFRAFEGRGPFTVFQIDAHADWADVIQGNADGYGSPMRRAAELPWITGMVQVGTRGLGSGGEWQIKDAKKWGSQLVTMRDFRRDGVERSLSGIPQGGSVLISIDCDGLDPAVLPAVNMPTPGGLGYQDVIELLNFIAKKARIAGFVLTELVPERDDPHRLSTLTAARIAAVALGLISRQQG